MILGKKIRLKKKYTSLDERLIVVSEKNGENLKVRSRDRLIIKCLL